MALRKSEIYSTLTKCTNKLRSNSGINAESFKNYVLILLFIKYISDRKKSGEGVALDLPEGCSFDDIVAMKGMKGSNERFFPGDSIGYKTIGEGINKIIAKISEANGLTDVIKAEKHDFCADELGDTEKSSKLIAELVSAFQDGGLDFSQNRAADDDLIGDAYEYLMRNFASQAGKDKGQFYTPTEVSRLMALLVGIDLDNRHALSAYDPTCGSASLLLRVRAAAQHPDSMALYGQDIDPANIELSYLNMFIHGCTTADIKDGDTLNDPQHTRDGRLQQFDYIVSNPKFSLHNWMNGAKENDEYGRWNTDIGVPPQQYGDFAFLMHCVTSLKHDGKCAIILPNGVLTRGSDEERLRKWLVDQRLLSGIIAFPANAFFGTSIAGNVLLIDKRRVSDGVFFIDGSELGYKDADSKIRLREQDIKHIIDVWRSRTDEVHFAHLAPFSEIEANNYALNLSLYVTPVDKEIHQNIDGHLHGGIPVDDIDRLDTYWNVCPSLKETLFKPLRSDFSQLAVKKDVISETIESNDSFIQQNGVFSKSIDEWCKAIEPLMLSVDVDNDPKSHITQWGQSILNKFKVCPSLVGAYDVYDQLLGYYNESMQDDLYIISNNGWNPQLNIPTKKNYKWSDLSCDLLPVNIAIEHFCPDVKARLDDVVNSLAQRQEQMSNIIEENEEDFDSSLFYGKFNKANLEKKIMRCKAIKLTEAEEAILNEMLPYLEKSCKANKEAVAALALKCPRLFKDGEVVKKAQVNMLIENSHNWEYSTPQQLANWENYLEMLISEKMLKDNVRKCEKALLVSVLDAYHNLTPETARPIIVSEKWLADIRSRINKEMHTVTHNISSDVTSLAKRYEKTLSALQSSFTDLESSVANHLKEMGFEL